MEYLRWIGHASFLLAGEKKVYIDPFNLQKGVMPKADVILITHSHFDHFSTVDIKEISCEKTVIVGPADVVDKLKGILMRKSETAKPGKSLTANSIPIEVMPAYNTNKNFHQKTNEWVGYVIEYDGKRYYFAGDTDRIPEMKTLTAIDIALVPTSGIYVMDYKEAAKAVIDDIRPTEAIPMHFGSVVGSRLDAEKFVKTVTAKGIRSEILEVKTYSD